MDQLLNLTDAQISLPGNQSCFSTVKDDTANAKDAALLVQNTLPSNDTDNDTVMVQMLKDITDALFAEYANCNPTTTTETPPSKILP